MLFQEEENLDASAGGKDDKQEIKQGRIVFIISSPTQRTVLSVCQQ